MKTGWIYRDEYDWYDMGRSPGLIPPGRFVEPGEHLDQPSTRRRAASLVRASGLAEHLTPLPVTAAGDTELLRVHTRDYLDFLISQDALPKGGHADRGTWRTPFGPGGLEIARLSAGGVTAAARAVVEGAVSNAYALVRPPGHHALPDRGMALCVFANVAVAIKAVRHEYGVGRVAVIDWDVHHGNGTQEIFWDDPDVLTVSIHQDRLLQLSTGDVEEMGGPDALGACLNVPLPPGSGSQAYREALGRIVLPRVRDFAPELIVVASGYDASFFDPNGHMLLGVEDYRWMTQQVVDLAGDICQGRLVVAHEGGYSPWYVPYCMLAVVETLAGERTEVADPVAFIVEGNPFQALSADQARALDRVEAALNAAPPRRTL
ncbi:Acetoin utilization deacetylase AcuC [Sinosporangium album]|uniref:Acetoin utilization deacetylase AcuC n=1 Tax=Sinosporangium album TaxID=504805 RepID=A0A1G7ZNZ0_9ACTN|nr:class II histone deacetylase [Sinosporangium album]SDH10433.1 Acetoin utilization deacetylase AcuC [Sinosporangium album]